MLVTTGKPMDFKIDDDIAAWYAETLRLRGVNSHPARLYKFVSVDSRHFQLSLHELLLHSRIYLSSRRDFNDPFDSSIAIQIPQPSDIANFVEGMAARKGMVVAPEHLNRASESPANFRASTQARLEESLDENGIYSMSDRVSHPLLWAHYASAHRGICLIFQHGVSDCMWAGMPMRYQPHHPLTQLTKEGVDISGMLCKGMEWSYEGEWRIVASKKARSWHELPSNALIGVVFGARCSDETFAFVIEQMQRRPKAGLAPLHVYRALVSNDRYELKFEKFGDGDLWQPATLQEPIRSTP